MIGKRVIPACGEPARRGYPGVGKAEARTSMAAAGTDRPCRTRSALHPQSRPQAARRAMSRFHLHLVSDSTGDTVHAVARACLVQFEGTEPIEHIWSMVRTKSQIERVVAGVDDQSRRGALHPGQRHAARAAGRWLPQAAGADHPGARSGDRRARVLSRPQEPRPAGPAASCSTANISSASTP